MIIQGTNIPIVITFNSDVSSCKKLVATLWISNKLVKKWETEDMTIDRDTVTLPLDEDETRTFMKGNAMLDVKGLNIVDEIIFWEEAQIQIVERRDKEIDLIE